MTCGPDCEICNEADWQEARRDLGKLMDYCKENPSYYGEPSYLTVEKADILAKCINLLMERHEKQQSQT